MNTLVSRRHFLAGALALRAIDLVAQAGNTNSAGNLVANEAGGFLFVPGTPLFRFAAVAAPGFDIVRATFRHPPLSRKASMRSSGTCARRAGPSPSSRQPAFVVAGIPEVRFLEKSQEIVAPNDVSLEGLRQKTVFVLESIERLLASIGAKWNDVTGIQLYTIRDLHPLIESVVLPRIGPAAARGIHWHYTLLPLEGGDVEIDVRSVREELNLEA